MALGPLVNHGGETSREAVIRELQREVPADRGFVEMSGRDLAAPAARDQVELQREKRVLRLRQLRRAARDNDQQPHVVDPVSQVSDQIRRRRIGPVHVVEAQDHRMHARDFFDQRRDLALQALLGADRGVGREARGRGVVLRRRRHDLHVPARRERANQARQAAVFLVALQAVEHLEHRKVGFASGEPLGTAAAPDPHGFTAILEKPYERIEERRLADAGFRRQHHDAPLAPVSALELVKQRVHFEIAADHRAAASRGPMRHRDGGERRGDRRIVRQPQSIEHFPRARTKPGIFLQRFEDELIERPRQLPG